MESIDTDKSGKIDYTGMIKGMVRSWGRHTGVGTYD